MRNKLSQKLYCYDSKNIPSSFVMTLGCEIQSGIVECQQIFASLIPGDIASNFIWSEGRVILSKATNWALMVKLKEEQQQKRHLCPTNNNS
uniref:Uncharacterized protein n=1 Tax=Glossina palpalis gambiensis TaxID=67801 RepID=A0A1B0AR43_9MUSC